MLAIELLKDDFMNIDLGDNKDNYEVIYSKKFQGQAETIQILFTVSYITIPIISNIIIQQIKSNKHVSVKYKGIEINGLSSDNVIKILKEIEGNKK